MRFNTTAYRVSRIRSRASFLFQSNQYSSRFLSQSQSSNHQKRPSFGIAFDIDGVILRGRVPIGGSPQSLRRLYGDSGTLKVPFLFLTNGGGIPESRRAIELSELLGVNIVPDQVVQGHSPFKNLLKRFENELIIATGKGEPALVMSEYGFKKVLSLDEYASYFESIDPVSQNKMWTTKMVTNGNSHSVSRYDLSSARVKAAFVVSDPVDWGRDIQVLCDILRSGGFPGQANGHQPPLYFAADDLEYQAAFPSERLGMGAFRIALESIFNRYMSTKRYSYSTWGYGFSVYGGSMGSVVGEKITRLIEIHHKALEYVSFGKPNPFVFKNAEAVLSQLQPSYYVDHFDDDEVIGSNSFKTLYMIGDNPSVDVKGARQAGHPWFSILTRTGVFRGKDNHGDFPADLVVDTVEEAVDYILRRECIS